MSNPSDSHLSATRGSVSFSAEDSTARSSRRRFVWITSLAFIVLTLLVFGQAARFDFISFDDERYVNHNPPLEAGLSAKGLAWAFTTNLTHLSDTAEYWEPLTLLTRLADYQLYGFHAGGQHLTSALLHLAAAFLLWGALTRLTGKLERSALVAALFLVHPMHVEAVLWLSARKDVVNGLFYIVTLWVYGWYAARPNWRRYLAVFAAALGANMGKPMAVSLPFVLLLLDLWPLRRWPGEAVNPWIQARRLILEKVPLFVLTIGVAALAVIVQRDIGAVDMQDPLPIGWRLGNAFTAIAIYVGKAFVPIHLSFFYPHPGRHLNVTLAVISGLGVLILSGLAVAQWSRRPWLTVGWFWFLVVLGPVLGLIQIGDQAMADRYSYISFIGLFIAIVWQVAEWSPQNSPAINRAISWALPLAVVAVFAALSFFQVRTWQSSETVFSQGIAVDPENYVAHYNLGAVLLEQGRKDEAMPHFQAAVRIREPILRAQLAAAEAAVQRGAYGEAIPRYVRVLLLMPWNADLHQQLGNTLARNRQGSKALAQFELALKYRPDWIQPRISIAAVLLAEGQAPKAEAFLHDVLVRDPGNKDAQAMLDMIESKKKPTPP